ncbi:MAG: hypothetical protein ACREIH_07800, partial [Nitrospiraceae bacterium]
MPDPFDSDQPGNRPSGSAKGSAEEHRAMGAQQEGSKLTDRARSWAGDAGGEVDRQKLHLRPVWIVLLLLVPCLALTVYYSQYMMAASADSDSLLPSTGYAFVLLLVNLDLVGLVVLTLLLSRSLIKAYFERRHRLVGSGFRAKLVAAFI